MKTIERTHRFPREQTIDCRDWVSFEFLTATMRDITLRYRKLDSMAAKDVESHADAGETPAPKT